MQWNISHVCKSALMYYGFIDNDKTNNNNNNTPTNKTGWFFLDDNLTIGAAQNSHTIFAYNSTTLKRSTNGGTTFSQIYEMTNIACVGCDSSGNLLFGSSDATTEIAYSLDGGDNITIYNIDGYAQEWYSCAVYGEYFVMNSNPISSTASVTYIGYGTPISAFGNTLTGTPIRSMAINSSGEHILFVYGVSGIGLRNYSFGTFDFTVINTGVSDIKWNTVTQTLNYQNRFALGTTNDETYVYYSVDAGETWNKLTVPTEDATTEITWINCSNTKLAIACGNGEMFICKNGEMFICNVDGSSMTKIHEVNTELSWSKCYWGGTSVLYASTSDNKLYKWVS